MTKIINISGKESIEIVIWRAICFPLLMGGMIICTLIVSQRRSLSLAVIYRDAALGLIFSTIFSMPFLFVYFIFWSVRRKTKTLISAHQDDLPPQL